jgi:hypothetical protein
MRIEIIKIHKGFFKIPQIESMNLPERFYATVELASPVLRPQTPVRKGTAYRLLEKTVMDMGADNLLEGILSRLPQDFSYVSDSMSDEDILYEALKEKYGL